MKRSRWLRLFGNTKILLALVVALLFGVCLMWGSDSIGANHPRIGSIIQEVASIFIGIAIIGGTLDVAFRQGIVKDVFESAMGYVLAPELRDEIRWIYELQFLAVRHSQYYHISIIDKDVVKLEAEVVRVVKNLTETSQKYLIGYAIDDWGIPGHSSGFVDVSYRFENESWESLALGGMELDSGARRFPVKPINVAPQDSLTIRMRFTEYKHLNDAAYMSFSDATRQPEIHVHRIDPRLQHRAWFGASSAAVVNASPDKRIYTFDGTLLPEQQMVIRWWAKEDETHDPDNPTC